MIIINTIKVTWTGVALAYPPIVIGTENSAMNTGKVPSRPGKTKSNSDHNSLRLFCIGVPVRMSLWGVSNLNRKKTNYLWLQQQVNLYVVWINPQLIADIRKVLIATSQYFILDVSVAWRCVINKLNFDAKLRTEKKLYLQKSTMKSPPKHLA